jgi:hypothetical protein
MMHDLGTPERRASVVERNKQDAIEYAKQVCHLLPP